MNITEYRHNHQLSQEQMAEILHVSTRSFADQEHGKYGFSALPFACFLFILSDDETVCFLKELKTIMAEEESLQKLIGRQHHTN